MSQENIILGVMAKHNIKTRTELAKELGVSRATLYNYENKVKMPSFDFNIKLYRKYGVPYLKQEKFFNKEEL